MSETAKLTPAMRQWREAKDLHPDKLLLFRMGDFYEMFNEDAVKGARLLGLTLTKRGKDPDAPPLAGVPHHQLERYLKELIDKGVSVAVCDQLEDPAQAKGVVKRGINRVETPGTIVDESILPLKANNYLAAAAIVGKETALAFADVSTGEFFVVQPENGRLEDEFERQSPAETLVSADIMADPAHPLTRLLALGLGGGVTRRDSYQFDPHEGATRLLRHFQVQTLAGYGLENRPAALGAAGAVLGYLQENQPNNLGHLRPPTVRDHSGYLLLDRNSIRNLELVSPPRSAERQTSLLSVMDRTLTGPGTRLFRAWLLRPPTRVEPIRRRQEAVAELMADQAGRRRLRELLDQLADLERITARVAAERATPRDLAALAASCRLLPDIGEIAGAAAAELLRDCAAFEPLDDVADLIEAAIIPNPPANLRDGGVIQAGFSPEIDELRDIKSGGKEWLRLFQEQEQERTGIPSLKVGFNRIHGYYIEITHAHKDKAPADYSRRQTLVNAERYITPALKEHEEKALGAEERLLELEQETFRQVREHAGRRLAAYQDAAARTAVLDVVAALADLGVERNYVMPEMHEGLDTDIVDGRHPVVEALLPQGQFIDNDLVFAPDSQRIIIITGPNMAGKSTYIRQVALLFIMAHMGAPIPAASARIGVADRIFTRVGAADDLTRGLSTFMVEMVETAEILHNATERSLVILDEVGRGTSTFDGVSLAWAITEYLHEVIKARTLFATHYHELAELGHVMPRAKNFNVAVRDWEKEIIFLHKIEPGASNRSYGIHVGQLAGIPKAVVKRATELLRDFEAQASERDYKLLVHSHEMLRAAAREVQLELFTPPKPVDEIARELILELAKIDVNRLTPLDAMGLLEQLSKQARGG